MTEKYRFRLNIITIPSIINSLLTLVLYWQFLRAATGNVLYVIVIQALLTPIILNLALSFKVRLFDDQSIPSHEEKTNFETYLSTLSSSPLKALMVILLMAIINIAVLASFLMFATDVGFVFVFSYSMLLFACLMLSSGFSYILLDNLIVLFLS